jgi:hypothetical protein
MLGRRIEGNQPVSSIGKDFNQWLQRKPRPTPPTNAKNDWPFPPRHNGELPCLVVQVVAAGFSKQSLFVGKNRQSIRLREEPNIGSACR